MKNKGFIVGYLSAVATLIRFKNGVEASSKELFQLAVKNDTSLSDLQKMGIDEYDLEVFQVHWDSLH